MCTVLALCGGTVCRGSLYVCALYRRSHMEWHDVILDADGYIVPRTEWVRELEKIEWE